MARNRALDDDNKVLEIKTHQLPEAREKANGGAKGAGDKVEKAVRSLNRELDDMSVNNDEALTSIRKLSATITNLLDENTVVLPEQGGIIGKAQRINEPDILNIEGNTKNRVPFSRVINSKIEDSTKRVTLYNQTGVYGKIAESKQNVFLESNMPILKTSLSFFVDDVINGSYRGDDYNVYQKFAYYINGALETNTEKIEKMNDILEPKKSQDLLTGVKSWSTLATHMFYNGRRDGYVITRVIPHKEIAKDLYAKYIMKEARKSELKKKNFSKKTKARVRDAVALEDVNFYLQSNGYQSVSLESDLMRAVPENILDDLPNSLYIYENKYYNDDDDVDEIGLENNEYKEMNTDETFVEFCERMLGDGTAHRIYNINFKPNREEVIGGECFTYEQGGVDSETGKAILDDIIASTKSNTCNNLQFNQIALESIQRDLNPIDQTALLHTSFEDIYNGGSYSISNNNKIAMESADDDSFINNSQTYNTTDRLYMKIRKSIENRADKIAMESNVFTPMYTNDNPLGLGGVAIDGINTTASSEEQIMENAKKYNRLDKMFNSIKGETTVVLDSRRTIPIRGGDRLIGCYLIEYSHQDIQHFVGMRTIIGNPISYAQNIDMLNIRSDEQEETLGRMVFADAIQPLLMKNMDTKFLKDNASILYCLYQLISENEIGKSMSFQDMTRYNMYNMSRIIFIPGNQLIFGRHGEDGLGISVFNEALVPANAVILANEAYLSWLLCDGKGMSFVQVPRGMSEIGGEAGIDNLIMRMDDIMISRAKLRDISRSNFPLTHKIIMMEKGEEATEDIEVKTVEFPPFQIDREQITRWEQEATNIVGYNSASFSSIDGTVELAKKLYEIDDTKLLEVLKCRRMFKLAFSQLATKLLQVRGGDAYANVTVEWLEPPVERNNNIKRSEIAKETQDTVDTYMSLIESSYGTDPLWDEVKPFVTQELIKRLSDKDSILSGMKDIMTQAKNVLNVTATEMVVEEENDKEEEKKNKDKESEGDE